MSRDSDVTPKFPTEMFEAIIDQVYALKEEDSVVDKLLGVFSLVSKSWLPRSRYHLFQKLTIDQERDPPMEGKPFLDLLDSPLCSFKPYVRILNLDESFDRGPMWLGDALPLLSVLLPSVQELRIRGGIFFISPNDVKVLSDFSNLQLLVLERCGLYSPAQLLETLSMCRSLKRISFSNLRMRYRFDSWSAVIDSPPPSSLTSIQMYTAVPINNMMEWLLSGEHVPAIETLNLSTILEHESRLFSHALRILGPCLKNLDVRFVSTQNEFSSNVDLAYNTNLHSICFRFGHTSVASLLARVTSFKVREVVVDVSRDLFERLSEVDWDTIARILDQPNFSKLERLIIPGRRDVAGVRQWMMQRLLPGRARDKLVVCEKWSGHP